jgi:hypothetical protein
MTDDDMAKAGEGLKLRRLRTCAKLAQVCVWRDLRDSAAPQPKASNNSIKA